MFGSSSVSGPSETRKEESGAGPQYDTNLNLNLTVSIGAEGGYKCRRLQDQSKGLSRQVCLLSEGWFDLGLEGWVDFNSRKGKGKRAILA